MKRVIWSVRARRDLIELNAWYGQISPDLPLTFTLRIEATVEALIDFPMIGPNVPDSRTRKWRAKRTPYVILYRPTKDGVRIVALRHERSDWKTQRH